MNEENMIDLLAAYPSGEPDEWDKEMIARITPSEPSERITMKEFDDEIHERRAKEFSGKLNIRIPKMLHQDLSDEAKMQGVSLNHYISHVLSSRVRPH